MIWVTDTIQGKEWLHQPPRQFIMVFDGTQNLTKIALATYGSGPKKTMDLPLTWEGVPTT